MACRRNLPPPGWRPQHTRTTSLTSLDWDQCVRALTAASPRLAGWPMEQGRRTGRFNLDAIERQLSRSGILPP